MPARKLSLRNIGLHNVARLESHEACVSRSMSFRETVLIGTAHLTRAMPHRSDLKWLNDLDLQILRRAPADACGVNPMRFRQLSLCSIEFGEAA
jgi:hypothetical protein